MTLPLTPWASPAEIEQGIADLKAAAQHLEDKGWTQHVYEDYGRCCAAGAINTVTNTKSKDVWHLARDFNSRSAIAAGIFYRLHGMDISTYNDGEGRSSAEVIGKMRDTATQAEAQLARELAKA